MICFLLIRTKSIVSIEINMMIKYLFITILFQILNIQARDYNFFMPDLPPSSASSSSHSSISTTRKIHQFSANSFNKISVSGGPVNVKFYQNPSINDNYTSVDVVADDAQHSLVSVEILANEILSIRLQINPNLVNQTNISITINFFELVELNIDGLVNTQCLNSIEADRFRLNHRANGFIKLKFHVNFLDAYLHSYGRVKICGQVNNEATIQSLGVGDVHCRNLLTKKINVISSGIGNLYVKATDEINIVLSGIGTVYYTGPIKQQMKTGLGNLIELPDE